MRPILFRQPFCAGQSVDRIEYLSPMEKPLRILHLEDQPDFSTLVSAVLEKEGLNAETVPERGEIRNHGS